MTPQNRSAICMETKLYLISEHYKGIPKYVAGSVANLPANKHRVQRETACAGSYDLWNRNTQSAFSEVEALSEPGHPSTG